MGAQGAESSWIGTEVLLKPWVRQARLVLDGAGEDADIPVKSGSAYERMANKIIEAAFSEDPATVDRGEVVEAVEILLDQLAIGYCFEGENQAIPRGFGAAYLCDRFWESTTGIVFFRALQRTLEGDLMTVEQVARQVGVVPDRLYYLIRSNALPVYLHIPESMHKRQPVIYLRLDQVRTAIKNDKG